MPRGRIGIVTGSGPEAGIDLWSKLLDENRRSFGDSFRGDIDAPDVTIVSVPELGISINLPESDKELWPHMQRACERISTHVDAFAIACNTLYFYQDAIEELNLPARLVSPVDSLHAEMARRNSQSFALLGAGPVTDFAADSSPYKRLSSDLDVELPANRRRLHELIERIKVHGGSSPELEEEFQAITSGLTSGVAALACTELPLLEAKQADLDLIDVTRLLARDLLHIAAEEATSSS